MNNLKSSVVFQFAKFLIENDGARYTEITRHLCTLRNKTYHPGRYASYFKSYVDKDYWHKCEDGKYRVGSGLPKKYQSAYLIFQCEQAQISKTNIINYLNSPAMTFELLLEIENFIGNII